MRVDVGEVTRILNYDLFVMVNLRFQRTYNETVARQCTALTSWHEHMQEFITQCKDQKQGLSHNQVARQALSACDSMLIEHLCICELKGHHFELPSQKESGQKVHDPQNLACTHAIVVETTELSEVLLSVSLRQT